MKKYLKENIDNILLSLVITGILTIFATLTIVSIIEDSVIIEDKLECYETYLTDNVI